MQKTKIFKSGNSMAIRLPANFDVQAGEVEIFQQGDAIIIRPISTDLSAAIPLLGKLENFGALSFEREDDLPQVRDF